MTVAGRSVRAVSFRGAANGLNVVLLFVRTVVLMRLLSVELFGAYAAAAAVVLLTEVLPNFGLGAALVNRAEETEDQEEAAATHFTLRLITRSIWAVALIGVAVGSTSGPFQVALIVLTVAAWFRGLGATAHSLLTRRVEHQRIALVQIVGDLVSTVIAITLALTSGDIWALVAGNLGAAAVALVLFYGWRPVWRPQLALDPTRVNYFLAYGRKVMVGHALRQLLENMDDLWVRISIGTTGLGFYSRAYQLAGLPRRLVAPPINDVALGTFAELGGQPERLSRAFNRSIGVLTRGGFLAGGMIAAVAPELIRLVLGEKWLPMADTFRLMLVFSLLDPMRVAVGHLFTGTGRARQLITITLGQVVVLGVLMVPLGYQFGIEGVGGALAASALLGTAALLVAARKLIDVDLRQIFFVPSLALALGLASAYFAVRLPGVLGEDWRTAGVKLLAFTLSSAAVMTLLERQWMKRVFELLPRSFHG